MRTNNMVLLAAIMFGACSGALAADGESIVFDHATGNYLITYLNSTDDSFRQIIFIPATKFNPTLNSRLKLEEGGTIHYGYVLRSGRDSQQDIRLLILDPVSSVTSSLPDISLDAPPGKIMDDMADVAAHFDTPGLWDASMAYSDGQMSFRVGWGYDQKTGGLTPGSKVVFGFKSLDLPGIIKAELHSYAPNSRYIPSGEVNEEDGGFGQQYTELVTKNFVPRYTAAPAIAVPSPFDAAVLLDRIQTHMHTWIAMQLLDPAFSAQLDRYFQSAISAYRLNQPKVGKKHIQTMRALLKKEQPGADKDEADNEDDSHNQNRRVLIDKLAARILDFDIKYVAKRMAGDNDD